MLLPPPSEEPGNSELNDGNPPAVILGNPSCVLAVLSGRRVVDRIDRIAEAAACVVQTEVALMMQGVNVCVSLSMACWPQL